jgi:hypothetical protein
MATRQQAEERGIDVSLGNSYGKASIGSLEKHIIIAFPAIPFHSVDPINSPSHADIDNEDLERNLQSIQAPELKNTAMTLAQILRQEGRQEGL